jgi:hypothetical protein
MGGKGGLNILPQKKWNVYNWDNRIKVEDNEKKVKKEIQKREVEKFNRKIDNKIKAIRNNDIEEFNFTSYEEVDRNKIFKEVMQRESILKRIDNDLKIEKLRNPMKQDERLKLFDDEKLEKKLDTGIENDVEEGAVKQITLKDSLSKHLQPWYTKKKKEDYAIYREFGKDPDEEFLKKKHKKDKKHKKEKHKTFKNELDEFAYKLNKERKKLIQKALEKNK